MLHLLRSRNGNVLRESVLRRRDSTGEAVTADDLPALFTGRVNAVRAGEAELIHEMICRYNKIEMADLVEEVTKGITRIGKLLDELELGDRQDHA